MVTELRLEDAVVPPSCRSPRRSGAAWVSSTRSACATIKRRLTVPVVVDAGVGTASTTCLTMEQGVDGHLDETALAAARDPVAMAAPCDLRSEAGATAYLAGRMRSGEVAMPSSPLERDAGLGTPTAARRAALQNARRRARGATLSGRRDGALAN